MRKSHISPVLILALATSLWFQQIPSPAAQNSYAFGLGYTNAGKYAAAVPYLKQAIAQDPTHMMAHYLLGNCYVHTHQHELAQKEYRICLKMSPDSSVAQYCKDALDAYQHPSKAELPARYSRFTVDTKRTEEEERAAALSKMQSQLGEQAAKLNMNDRLARQTMEEAKAEAAKIKASAQEEQDSIPYMRRGGSLRTLERNLIKQDADQQVDQKMRWAQQQADQYHTSASQRASGLNDTQSGLESQLQAPAANSGVRLNPAGTNLYVRNYSQSK